MVYLHVLSPVVALAINVLAQICYCRFVSNKQLLKSLFFGFFCGMFMLFVIEAFYVVQLLPSVLKNIPSVLINIASYSALGYCYFHFVNLGETARRIRLLRELSESKNGLSVDEILQRYNAKEIMENRLSRLLKSEQVVYKDNRYYIGKPVMFFMSKAVLFLKVFILGKKSEFE
ncbi:MAG: hypothetical protein PHT53_03085 [Candidatus Omnitrophica bacterium]|nr:hypothetical protein [Candidatus Omnitrophota bacterium]